MQIQTLNIYNHLGTTILDTITITNLKTNESIVFYPKHGTDYVQIEGWQAVDSPLVAATSHIMQLMLDDAEFTVESFYRLEEKGE